MRADATLAVTVAGNNGCNFPLAVLALSNQLVRAHLATDASFTLGQYADAPQMQLSIVVNRNPSLLQPALLGAGAAVVVTPRLSLADAARIIAEMAHQVLGAFRLLGFGAEGSSVLALTARHFQYVHPAFAFSTAISLPGGNRRFPVTDLVLASFDAAAWILLEEFSERTRFGTYAFEQDAAPSLAQPEPGEAHQETVSVHTEQKAFASDMVVVERSAFFIVAAALHADVES